MGSQSADKQNAGGLSWAEQWDYKEKPDASNDSDKHNGGKEGSKFAEYNKKFKAAASTGFGKAKSAATVGAKKIKSGTSSGIRWIKDRYHKRSQK